MSVDGETIRRTMLEVVADEERKARSSSVPSSLQQTGRTPPKDLSDWRIKRVLDAIAKELHMQKTTMATELFEQFEAYRPAFVQQIRAERRRTSCEH
jgi:hypothetical protein